MTEQTKRIVVPTDLSSCADLALDEAVAEAKLTGGDVELLQVEEPLPYVGVDGATVPYSAEYDERVDADLAERARLVREAGVQCSVSRQRGIAWQVIVEHAERVGARRIVMATHGRTGIRHVLLGSVAERVIQHAHCPVLVIPSRDKPAAG